MKRELTQAEHRFQVLPFRLDWWPCPQTLGLVLKVFSWTDTSQLFIMLTLGSETFFPLFTETAASKKFQ